MKRKLAIFDIDGTLTDTVSIHQAAFFSALKSMKLKDFDTNWSNYTHHTDHFIFKTIFEKQFARVLGNSELIEFENYLTEYFIEATREKSIEEVKGAVDFINKIQNNFDIVFATGSLLKPAKLKLQQAGINYYDELLIAANLLYTRDEIVLKAIEQAKIFYDTKNYEQVISFGDGLWDYETAKNLNIDFIGIGNSNLKDHGIPNVFPDFTSQNLVKLIEAKLLLNFEIKSNQRVSKAFTENNIFDFKQAVSFLRNIPYGRNTNKQDLTTVFSDACGTCSSKHALLKQLAMENSIDEVKLIIGLFEMNAENTPEVADTLKQNNLDYMPEAHCYLKIDNEIIDVMKVNSKPENFVDDLIEEIEIQPNDITDFKVNYHKMYLEKWLLDNREIEISLNELWAIREECIMDLQNDRHLK
jgi:beta-phosphoglucomutase-like phosphatase (HAD superfamily)